MELRQLRFVKAVAVTGSFSAAAAEEHITEPGLHKQVRKLEAELGIQLFERSGRAIRITSAGTQLIHNIDSVIAGVREIESLAYDLRAGNAGVVTISCYPVHVVRFLAPAIGAFERENPGLKVRLGEHPGDQTIEGKQDLYEALFQGRIDLTIGPLRPIGVSSIKAYTARGIAVVGDNHPLRKHKTISVEALRDKRLIALPKGLWFRGRLEEACAAAGFQPRIEVETTVESLVALCREDYAIGVLSDDNLWGSGNTDYPIITEPSGADLSTTNWLQWREDQTLSPAVNAFIKYVERIKD